MKRGICDIPNETILALYCENCEQLETEESFIYSFIFSKLQMVLSQLLFGRLAGSRFLASTNKKSF